MGLSDKDFKLKESPEHAIWLEQNIEPRFWSKFKSLVAEWQEFQKKLACGIIKMVSVQKELKQEKKRDQGTVQKCGIASAPYVARELGWLIVTSKCRQRSISTISLSQCYFVEK
jgi:hypothetical protein